MVERSAAAHLGPEYTTPGQGQLPINIWWALCILDEQELKESRAVMPIAQFSAISVSACSHNSHRSHSDKQAPYDMNGS